MPPRPEGELIWLHVPERARLSAMLHLAARISFQRAGVHFLLTTGSTTPPARRLASNVQWCATPSEHPGDCEAFLAHWTPALCLWSHGLLRPTLMNAAGRADVPMVLLDASESGLEDSGIRWLPDMARSTVGRFTAVHAVSANAARRLRRLGVRESDLRLSGPLQEASAPPDCKDDDLEEMTAVLAGRPVWQAAMAVPEEMPCLMQAHRAALRHAHRLLMIVVPDDPDRAQEFAAALAGSALTVARWSLGEMPEENVQVLLADTHGEIGLWYRLAPVTLMGASLAPGHGGRNPYEPAALGSAILHGPNVEAHADAYARLAEAGAARRVDDSDRLSAALARLIAPDQAAIMAHAAWEVVSEGAEVTDMVTDLVLDMLDMMETP